MRRDPRGLLSGVQLIDIAWVAFSLANLAAMLIIPEWETVPFHFIWVSLTILYGFRVWRTGPTLVVLGAVMGMTGVSLVIDFLRGAQPLDELTEVPLMAAMFLAMVWHARRRLRASEEMERVSKENLELLERERRFVQDASHELRTPITVALGHAELIERTAQDPVVVEDVTVIADELMRLRRLVDRLLVLASAEGAPLMRTEPIDLGSFVADVVHRWKATPRRWVDGEMAHGTVRADTERLEVAMDAVIENAVQHTGEPDEIQIAVHRDGGRMIARVTDGGSGIPERDLDRVFERFARADAGRSRDTGGFGLGLSIVREIVRGHGGEVRISSAEGSGTAVEIDLPLADGAVSEPFILPELREKDVRDRVG